MIAAVVVCTAFDCRQIRRKNMLFCRTNCYASVTEYSRSERLVVQVENDLCSEQTIVVAETATKNATCLIELARPAARARQTCCRELKLHRGVPQLSAGAACLGQDRGELLDCWLPAG